MDDTAETRLWFTPLLNDIAAVAGVRAALMIGRDKACQRVYIPGDLKPGHWLPLLVGDEAALRIVKEFGGRFLDIPPALGGQMMRRRRAIIQMSSQGYSINHIARTLGIARSTVTDTRRIAGIKGGAQPDLFGD